MVHPATWLAIPAAAIACGGIAGLSGLAPIGVLAIAALAAAIAAAVRAFAGTSLAAAIAATTAALLATFCVLDLQPRAALATTAALFAIASLARPTQPDTSPLPALGAAFAASVLDPSFVALIAITGVRFVRGPWTRPRWSIALPALGALAIVLALAAALTREGPLAQLWMLWAGRAGHATPLALAQGLGDTLGPLAAVAALAGIAACVVRGQFATAAIVGALVGALATDAACGTLGVATLALAAVTTGVALGRLAQTVHWPLAQPFVGAVGGFVIVIGPALYRW